MKDKEQAQKLFLLLLVVFAVLYSYANYIFLPQWNHLVDLRQQVQQSQALLQKLTYYSQHRASLEQQISAAQEQLIKGTEQVPALINKPQLTVDIYSMAKLRGVIPDSIKFDKIQSQGSSQTMGVHFSGSGQAVSILEFVQDLHKSKDLLSVQEFTISANQGSMHVELGITAYATSGLAITSEEKPSYMDYPFGVTSLFNLFSSFSSASGSNFLAPSSVSP